MTMLETPGVQNEAMLPSFVSPDIIARLGDLGVGEVQIGTLREGELDKLGPAATAVALQQISDALGKGFTLVVRSEQPDVTLFASPYMRDRY